MKIHSQVVCISQERILTPRERVVLLSTGREPVGREEKLYLCLSPYFLSMYCIVCLLTAQKVQRLNLDLPVVNNGGNLRTKDTMVQRGPVLVP